MPRTRTKKPRPKPATVPPVQDTPPVAAAAGEVLTLAEAAAYLRVPEADLLQLVNQQEIPARRIGRDWRILKPALQDWLRTPMSLSSKEALRSVIGAWKDHPDLDQLLEEIYRQRGRPMTEEGE
jgi:excisionase family DNA binding protein